MILDHLAIHLFLELLLSIVNFLIFLLHVFNFFLKWLFVKVFLVFLNLGGGNSWDFSGFLVKFLAKTKFLVKIICRIFIVFLIWLILLLNLSLAMHYLCLIYALVLNKHKILILSLSLWVCNLLILKLILQEIKLLASL